MLTEVALRAARASTTPGLELPTGLPRRYDIVRDYAEAGRCERGELARGLRRSRSSVARRDREGRRATGPSTSSVPAPQRPARGELPPRRRQHSVILDWEYAGMGDRCFDLGNFAVNNELDDAQRRRALLEAYFGEPPTAPPRRR